MSESNGQNFSLRLNQRVQHRGWRWTGTVTDFPFDYTPLSSVTVQRDGASAETEEWLPCLMLAQEDEEIDWSVDT